jgi:hypothetical protein
MALKAITYYIARGNSIRLVSFPAKADVFAFEGVRQLAPVSSTKL